MFNYENLSDYEFELLSCDIMSKKLGIELHTFAKGKDGGIDVTDNVHKKNIVIQVKHYIKSPFSALLSTLKKEVEKVKSLNPKQYYICCAQRLTANNINDIFKLFIDYMDTPSNVLTLNEFDQFLDNSSNNEILRKHYKLWLESSNILNEIFNRNIFIDCESLLYDINETSKEFVKSIYYDKCLNVLEHDRILLILGLPGVGKTITTKMLSLYYASIGYQIRYTTDGEIANLKRAISLSKDINELIILDDALGQTYFKMKETQENELMSLIKYVSLHPSKKLIMNSRVTIYNEAKSHSIEFSRFTEDKEKIIKTIDMSNIPLIEKGMIFYNHLYFSSISSDYYRNIVDNKNYRKIVSHYNYTPRIIEYVTSPSHLKNITPTEYTDFILNSLNNPKQIWQNEYTHRLLPEDRILVTTLYSLTDNEVDEHILKRAYNYRISNELNIDSTKNLYDEAISRLCNSMLIIVDKNNKRMIKTINPSVNDFLKDEIYGNSLEYKALKRNASEYIQIQRLFADSFPSLVKSGEAMKLHYKSEIEYYLRLLSCICEYSIKNISYQHLVDSYLNDLSYSYFENVYPRIQILCCLLSNNLNSFYNTRKKIDDNTLSNFFSELDLDEISDLYKYTTMYDVTFLLSENEDHFISGINQSISKYCNNVSGENYYEGYDLAELVESCSKSIDVFSYSSNGEPYVDQEYELDDSLIEKTILSMIEDDLIDEIHKKLETLPEYYKKQISIVPSTFNIDLHDLNKYIESYYIPDGPDYDDDYESHSSSSSSYNDLDYIFK